ncbi:hypothetical protein F2Q70_00014160 [Brassica cretica]|uniref:malate dehydrogenase n=1 Tax=Brassica cretica TaxID=69181 RepID=A0A8S9HSP5_BRACR|nr:hypothetical protein F2Q70_00014160 [Brassica cretica]
MNPTGIDKHNNMSDNSLTLNSMGDSQTHFCSDVSNCTDDSCRLVLGLGPTSASYCYGTQELASRGGSLLQLGLPDTLSGLDPPSSTYTSRQCVVPPVDEGSSSAKRSGGYMPSLLLDHSQAEVLGLDPREVDVPVVGGHAGVTILPLLSQVKPPSSFTPSEIEYLTNRIQNGGTEVVEAKAGAGSATLSMAYAAAKFADACLRGLRGDANVIECSFVASQVTELAFFATKVRLGRTGAEEVFQLGPLNEYERVGLEKAKEELAGSIQKGVDFIRK